MPGVERPQLQTALEFACPGNTLVIWRLDRFGRSLQENLDTTTPTGRLTFHLCGTLAEFERDLIQERTWAGVQAARAQGRMPAQVDNRMLARATSLGCRQSAPPSRAASRARRAAGLGPAS